MAAMNRCFVEPRLAPIGNSFCANVDHASNPESSKAEAFLRRHSFGDYVPHSLADKSTQLEPEEEGTSKSKGGKSKAVKRPAVSMASLCRRRTTGTCKVAQDPDSEASLDWVSSLASESTQYAGPDGVSSVNSLSSWDPDASMARKRESVAAFIAKQNSLKSMDEEGPGFNVPSSAWASSSRELEQVSRQLAEGAREAYLKRLSTRSGAVALESDKSPAGEELPTLLRSRAEKDVGRRQDAGRSTSARVRGLAAGAAAAAARLPVLLGSRGRRAAEQNMEEVKKGTASASSGSAEPAAASSDGHAREAQSLGAGTRTAFAERQRRISNRFERCLAAFVV